MNHHSLITPCSEESDHPQQWISRADRLHHRHTECEECVAHSDQRGWHTHPHQHALLLIVSLSLLILLCTHSLSPQHRRRQAEVHTDILLKLHPLQRSSALCHSLLYRCHHTLLLCCLLLEHITLHWRWICLPTLFSPFFLLLLCRHQRSLLHKLFLLWWIRWSDLCIILIFLFILSHL